ncbi:MAG: aldehyde dehydrogenase family protein, partial [Candidatus Omnitrophota bacterium]|nr:aldehyde dehydrogenase family protein [Candidatus Omnitrophota bacterium]
MVSSYPLYINGEFVEGKSRQVVINPSNGEAIAEVAVASDKEIELAVNSCRRAFDEGVWPKITLAQRKEFLLKISQGILDKAGELARLETLNTGKPIKESTFMDIPSSVKTFEYFANHLEEYLKEETRDLENARSRLVREPHGVAVLIVPWNYPLLIACWKLAQALAAGNTVILKPSSLTPLTVLELAKIVEAAGLPKGVVNIINASGDMSGELLCADKRVDMISFTGSPEVGKKIIGYSSWNVKKLIMELGGKSAGIVLKDADLELAVNGSLCSIFLNQGQMCTAMSRILVEDNIYDRFIEEFTAKVKKIKLGDGLNYETQMGPLVSRAQREKVIEYVEKARKEGAKLLCGGKVPENAELKNGFFFEPTVFTDVLPRMSIFQEEVFGPVVCVSKFSDPDEAIKLANATDFALACAIWSADTALAQKLASQINSGVCWVNTYGMFYNEVPYGGFKQSGFGKELGREG